MFSHKNNCFDGARMTDSSIDNCDLCGRTFPYHYLANRGRGMKVCGDCLEEKEDGDYDYLDDDFED